MLSEQNAYQQAPLKTATPSPSPFFLLARELRDEIYHHVWMSSPHLHSTFHGVEFQLYYNCTPSTLPYRTGNNCSKRPKSDLRWLFTNKTIMREALEQFDRGGVEWLMSSRNPRRTIPCHIIPLPTEMTKRVKLLVYVPRLEVFERPSCRGIEFYQLQRMHIANIAAQVQAARISVERLRFVACGSPSRIFRESRLEERIQGIGRLLRELFEKVKVQRWQLGVEGNKPKTWTVMDIDGDKALTSSGH
jgi:hypothetical protein